MKKHQALLAALAAGLALLASAGAQASCYTVRDAKGNIISESPNPPVDMSKQLHETVPVKYGPGATMSFGLAEANCGKEIDIDKDTYTPQTKRKKTVRRKKRARRRA